MLLLEVTFRDGTSVKVEISDGKTFQDLRPYFNADKVEILRVYPSS